MGPEVLFHGEYVDKDWLNVWLNSPEGQRKYQELKEQEAKEKAQEQERKKQLQKQKRAASKSKAEKAAEYFHKYRQELGPDVVISEEYGRMLWQRARNMVEYDLQHEEWLKQQAEEQRIMEQQEKQRKERKEQERKRRQEYEKNLPEHQVQMILTGKRNKCYKCGATEYAELYANHHLQCPVNTGEDLEPGLNLLKQEYSAGRIIRLDEQTHKRLAEFAIPDESYRDLINRLLDIAAAKD